MSGSPTTCVLFGALRSGTTMLRLMLDHHPQLSCPGEADFIADHVVADPTEPSGWTYSREGLTGNRMFRGSGAPLPGATDAQQGFAEMCSALRRDGAQCLVLDMHRGLERVLDLFPGTKVIHLLRDPRDVARSAIGMGWAGHVYYGADVWLRTEAEFERCRARLAPGQVIEIRYEDVVRDAERDLTRICEFLGLGYDPAFLSFPETSTYSAPDPTLAEQWRRKQSPRELGLVEPRLSPIMEERGYVASGHPAIRPGVASRLALWLINKRGIWRERIRRYGLRDPLVLGLARRVGLRKTARKAQRRIDGKVLAYLK